MKTRALAPLAAVALLALALAAPAGAISRSHSWPGLPAISFPHLRDGNNTTGNETDLSPPVLVITSHRDRETVKESRITLRGTASDASGVQSVEVSINGGDWAAASGNLTWSLPVRLEEGRNSVSVRATDLAGNVAEQNISIVLDTAVKDNSGLLLASAVIIPVVALIVLFILRRRAPPAGSSTKEDDVVEKRLGLEGRERDTTGEELGDSEEVTRLEESTARKERGTAKSPPSGSRK
jgi:hypothetical protein